MIVVECLVLAGEDEPSVGRGGGGGHSIAKRSRKIVNAHSESVKIFFFIIPKNSHEHRRNQGERSRSNIFARSINFYARSLEIAADS